MMRPEIDVAELSLNGWPVIQGSGDPRLRTGWVPGADRRLTTRKEALPLFLAVAADWHRWIHTIDDGAVDTGGYANRDARAVPGRKSNHASGTAIDIDWSGVGAPVAKNRVFWKTKESQMRRILKIYSILNWGGDWSPAYWDPMHIELRPGSNVGNVHFIIDKLGIGQDGVRSKNRFGLPARLP